ncbi:GDSL esterase/lipase 7-like [Amaranthus tricolor]|uniref:GDSL esterase/lipase 7-like n=1 Tax=Amaranthus tricolor TaxID=29722 RepID=UPI0025880DD3|nr:GDSL esterase/lipase 7-like [Amaranthus tricolor]
MLQKSHFCFVFILLFIIKWGDCSSSPPLAPAMFVFGDSLSDGGNNNWLPTLAKANYPPYGTNFPDGPTGRFTNGKLVIDFIADYLGLPYPPPYIMPFRPKIVTGYNYASAACGILPETGKEIGLCLDLEEQVKLFERTIRKQLSSKLKNPSQLSQHLEKSIFMVNIGSNDFLGNYFGSSSGTRQRYNPQQFNQLLIDALSLKLQELYKLGARKLVVFELGPLGCLSSMVRRFKPEGRCDENINQIVKNFNTRLALMLKSLTSSLQHSHFILGRAHWLGYDAIINPTKYGLIDGKNPCCKTLGNGTLTCIPFLPSCKNPNQHFFWDGSHLTEAINSLIASQCISGSSVCLPFNIQQLVQL